MLLVLTVCKKVTLAIGAWVVVLQIYALPKIVTINVTGEMLILFIKVKESDKLI